MMPSQVKEAVKSISWQNFYDEKLKIATWKVKSLTLKIVRMCKKCDKMAYHLGGSHE